MLTSLYHFFRTISNTHNGLRIPYQASAKAMLQQIDLLDPAPAVPEAAGQEEVTSSTGRAAPRNT